MWTGAAKRRYALCLGEYLDNAGLAANAATCRAARYQMTYVLELHPHHPGHAGYICAAGPSGSAWYPPYEGAGWTSASRRRIAFHVASFGTVKDAGAKANVCRVCYLDSWFVLAQYPEHPAHRAGVFWPRGHMIWCLSAGRPRSVPHKRYVTATRMWALDVFETLGGEPNDLRGRAHRVGWYQLHTTVRHTQCIYREAPGGAFDLVAGLQWAGGGPRVMSAAR